MRAQLERLSGLLLLLAVIFAPWFWGCTWSLGETLLDLILLVATICWLPTAVRRPNTSAGRLLLPGACAAWLLLGWGMTLNARGVWAHATGLLGPVIPPIPWLPGSIDRESSWATMSRLTALLGTVLVVAQLGSRASWRRVFRWTLIGTGVSLIFLGLWQRRTDATDILWGSRHLDFFFATYRNVTDAGALLNFIAPVAAAQVVITARRGPAWTRALATAALLIIVAGVVVTGSKIAPLILAVMAVAFLALHRPAWKFPAWIAVALGLVAVRLVVQGMGTETAAGRWTRFFSDGGATLTSRWAAYGAAGRALPDAGAFGFGPGTFPAIFPYYNPPPGQWLAAHNDYLQTLLEFGLLGSLPGAYLFVGAFTTLIRAARRRLWRTEERADAAGFGLALAGMTLLAAVDFPFQIASLQLAAAIAVGLAWSSPHWPRLRPRIDFAKTSPSMRENFLARSLPKSNLISIR